ncbi:AcrR family transcriptional regulator [Brevibacterium sediminis]|uniref:AcrR family transcriptional regulator n=1 Tax=Brevibacterium sediminis TaxID=1857024 RepID=A0ABQ1N2M3_9MICO|nr:TetR/AcrR family transcriptional regulator [Brevibacterium sediminis]GGC49512.1 AcrR family transcriptional regulator [Brevibacterium sediminis]
MAYRATQRTRANAEARRAGIERAARHVIARGGFASANVAAVAVEADCSAGSIYTYFSNRDELLRLVFAQAAGHELDVIAGTVAEASTASEIAESTVEVFVRRAVAGRRLAHALLLEEVPEPVQSERLRLRRGYVAVIGTALDRVGGTQIPAEVAARSIVGCVGENLVDILDPTTANPSPAEIETLVKALITFTRSALGEP